MSSVERTRTIVYIDGFNLYYGIRDTGNRRLLWLDLVKLARALIRQEGELVVVKYFTARIAGPAAADRSPLAIEQEQKRLRQVRYLEVIATLSPLETIEGQYYSEPTECLRCGNRWYAPGEKMSDVNLATHLLSDAFDDRFDTAMLVTGDSDQVPPIREIRRRYPHKQIIVAMPPHRHSVSLSGEASKYFGIKLRVLENCQLPDRVIVNSGCILERPADWR